MDELKFFRKCLFNFVCFVVYFLFLSIALPPGLTLSLFLLFLLFLRLQIELHDLAIMANLVIMAERTVCAF